jgi:hypothetical protein
VKEEDCEVWKLHVKLEKLEEHFQFIFVKTAKKKQFILFVKIATNLQKNFFIALIATKFLRHFAGSIIILSLIKNLEIDVKRYFGISIEKLNFSKMNIPPLIKGVRGTSSAEHDIENLAKRNLRTHYNLQVNKMEQ